MGELDLIPAGYRRARRLRAALRRLALAHVLAILAIVVVKLALSGAIRSLDRELEDLRHAEQQAREQESRLAELRSDRAALDRELAALEALRGSIAVRQLFRAVDRSIDANIRFLHWEFRRAGERVESEPKTVSTGYFLVVPKRSRDAEDEAWLMHTNMEIRGRASDHSALAGFVQRLMRQPEIEDARIRNTQADRHASTEPVNFDLAVVVRGRTT